MNQEKMLNYWKKYDLTILELNELFGEEEIDIIKKSAKFKVSREEGNLTIVKLPEGHLVIKPWHYFPCNGTEYKGHRAHFHFNVRVVNRENISLYIEEHFERLYDYTAIERSKKVKNRKVELILLSQGNYYIGFQRICYKKDGFKRHSVNENHDHVLVLVGITDAMLNGL